MDTVGSKLGERLTHGQAGPSDGVTAGDAACGVDQLADVNADARDLQALGGSFGEESRGGVHGIGQHGVTATLGPGGHGVPRKDRALRELDETGRDLGAADVDADGAGGGYTQR